VGVSEVGPDARARATFCLEPRGGKRRGKEMRRPPEEAKMVKSPRGGKEASFHALSFILLTAYKNEREREMHDERVRLLGLLLQHRE